MEKLIFLENPRESKMKFKCQNVIAGQNSSRGEGGLRDSLKVIIKTQASSFVGQIMDYNFVFPRTFLGIKFWTLETIPRESPTENYR